MCKKLSFLVSCILVLSLVSNASAVIGQKDIGNPAIPGSSSEVGGVWTVTASGADIWGTGDQMHYVYRPMSGDGEIVVDLTSRTMDPLHAWSKVGIMIRETSDAGSKHCALLFTGQADGSGNEYQIAYRPATGLDSYSVNTSTAEMPPPIPQTLKILRTGNTIQCWWYKEVVPGVIYAWTLFGQVDIPMASDVLIGMAVTSHDNAVLCTATYENVVWPADPYEAAWDMLPVDGAGPLPLQPELTWMRGDSAAMHDIYLGTDPGALPLVDSRPAGVESYTPPAPLDGGKIYYWQIVEQPLGIAGPVYSFKTERPGFGTIQRCVWEGIGNTNIIDLTSNPAYPQSPSWCDELPQMGYTDFADNYGARMQGYLVPETSGDYTFWIAGDDSIELWLSTDDTSCNLQKIAEHVGWTSNYNWFDAPEQQSAAIPLVAGQKYLIRSLHKEGGGGDGCQVAWYGPDQPVYPVQGNSAATINGYYLQPANDPYASKLFPPDGSTFTPHEAAEPVSWAPGYGAVSHNVYFGPDPGSMALIATVPMPQTSILLPAIPVGTTAYWGVEADDGTQTYPPCSASSITVQEWVSLDIGRSIPDPPGSSSYDEATGEYTLRATGTFELWGQSDEFHYLYTTMEMTRNAGSIKARVLSIEQPNEWRRAGVMIRESRAANTRKVMAHKTGHDNTRMQWREQPGWDTWNTGDNWGLGFPTWVRIDRDGENYNGYRSFDGQNWTHLGGMWCPMPSDRYVCVGLALCHHPNVPFGEWTIGKFDNLEIYTADPLASWNPSPGDGASNVPLDVTLSWNAGENAGSHLLYISQNYEDVLYGLVSPIHLPLETTSYNIGKLDLGKPYYWCVDELRREGRDVMVAFGPIWTFQVEPYRLIEDFETYCITPDPLPDQVEVPGEVIVAAVPPPDQAWVDPVSITVVEAVPPDAGCLIAEWAFEGSYDDTSGSGFHGTPVGNVGIVTDPERGNVLSLGGDQDYVDCGNPAALNFGTNNWSLSAWVKNTMTGTGDSNKGCIVGNGGDGGGGHRYCLIQSEEQEAEVTLVTDDNVTKYTARGDTTQVNDDVWHHVLGVRDGDTLKVYIDGVLEGSKGGLASTYDLSGTSQANVLIGAMTLASDGSIYKTYAGLIDDVQIYNCALSEGNARFMAGIGDETLDRPGYYGPMIAHYALDEGSGTTAIDDSGNGLDAAISGAVYTAITADGSASCLDFNGFGDHALNEVAGPYLEGLYEMSISLWIQSDLIDTDKGFIMLADSTSDRHGMRYDTVGGDGGGDDVVKYGVMTSGGNEEDESSAGLQTTEWQHLVLSWKSGEGIKLYVNGVLDIPTSDKGPVTGYLVSQTRIMLGKGGKDSAADAGWDGRIDDVRIYDKALSEGEARYLAGVGDLLMPPGYEPLVAHFEFEGNLEDSSGNDNHGTPVGAGITIEVDPVMGQVLSLPGGDNIYVEVGSVGISGNMPTTIACWAKADHTSIPDWTLVFGFSTPGGGCGSHFNIGSIGGPGGVGAHAWCWEERIFSDQEALDWHHYAMTYDGSKIEYFGDGRPMDTDPGKSNYIDLSIRGDYVNIGKRNTQASSFPGKVDDARVYNVALTPEQISGIVGCENPLGNTWFSNGTVMPELDYTVAHWGKHSMKIRYNGGPSQVLRIPPFDDFGAGNAKGLVLYFKGDAGNAPGQLFAQIAPGCKVEYTGSPEDVMNPDWQEWNIALADFPCWPSPATLLSIGVTEGSGVLWFDDFRLYPRRCVPALSAETDFNRDCIVDGKDLRIHAGEWLAETQVEDWAYRAVYYDSRYPTGWADTDVAVGVRDYLDAAGYTVLNADELKTWMDDRIADGALSVVVMAQDIAPDTVAETRDASCTLRKYLDAGGKVVQYADIPFYNQGHADGTTTNWATDGSVYILGFNAAGAGWDSGNTVTITGAGANWGLTTPWISNRPARAMDVDTILATDNDGDASGWAKRYTGGDYYRGFVYIADFDPSAGHVPLIAPALQSVAEYKGGFVTDVFEDGAVNFKDYAIIVGEDWLVEQLWP